MIYLRWLCRGMVDLVRFRQPLRRWLMGFSIYLPDEESEDWYLKLFYPDDCVVMFKEPEPEVDAVAPR